ncbi:MAG: hypothetical protein PGN13_16115 [Patulibacter minatonensis]
MHNPFNGNTSADVTDERAAVLERRGWVRLSDETTGVIATTPAEIDPDLFSSLTSDAVADAREIADWLVAEARAERDDALKQRDNARAAAIEELQKADADLQSAAVKIGTLTEERDERPTVEQAQELQRQIDELTAERDELTAALEKATAPDGDAKAAPAGEPAETPKAAPRRKAAGPAKD